MAFNYTKNLAQSSLASGYTAGNTSITVQSGDGALFDAPNFVVAIGNPPQFFLEVTGVSGDTFTVNASGFDGSTPISVSSATPVTEVITAGVLQALLSAAPGMTLLEEHTASASTEIDFTTRNVAGQSGATFQSDYDEYLIEIVNLVNSTGANNGFQVSTNGGSSYDTGSNYGWIIGFSYAGGSGASGNGADTQMSWRNGATTLGSGGSWNGYARFMGPASTTLLRTLVGQIGVYDSSVGLLNFAWMGNYTVTGTAINALRLVPTTGNFTSGVLRIYGLKK